jgi:hypothetical protein
VASHEGRAWIAMMRTFGEYVARTRG